MQQIQYEHNRRGYTIQRWTTNRRGSRNYIRGGSKMKKLILGLLLSTTLMGASITDKMNEVQRLTTKIMITMSKISEKPTMELVHQSMGEMEDLDIYLAKVLHEENGTLTTEQKITLVNGMKVNLDAKKYYEDIFDKVRKGE